MRTVLPREFYIPKDAETEDLSDGDQVARYTISGDRPCALVFHGKAQKPDWHHSFRTAEHCEKRIADWHEGLTAQRAEKTRRKQERAAFQHGFQVGDILSGSWGWEQTNVDFWQVTEVRGCDIIMRHLASRLVKGEEGFMQGRSVPLPDEFSTPNGDKWETLRKRPSPQYGGGKGSVKITSYLYADEWSGCPMFCSWYG